MNQGKFTRKMPAGRNGTFSALRLFCSSVKQATPALLFLTASEEGQRPGQTKAANEALLGYEPAQGSVTRAPGEADETSRESFAAGFAAHWERRAPVAEQLLRFLAEALGL